MPKLVFEVHGDEYSSLLNKQIELKDFLTKILNSRKGDITEGLLEYHKESGGAPIISEFDIVECWYDEEKRTGKIKFRYEVFFTFGCADLHPSEFATETSKFEIDPANSQLILCLTDHITRDTSDEF